MSQAVPSWTSDFRRSRESKSVAKSTAKHKKFVAHLAASQVGSFIAPGLALDGFSLTSHASSHASHNNDGELQSGRGFAVVALLLRMTNSWRTHHDRSGNCALRFRRRTQSRAPATPLALCFTILVALPRHDVTLNALEKCRELFVDSFHENL